jgi:hypothetical protein
MRSLEARFAAADLDGDGVLSLAEFTAMANAPSTVIVSGAIVVLHFALRPFAQARENSAPAVPAGLSAGSCVVVVNASNPIGNPICCALVRHLPACHAETED